MAEKKRSGCLIIVAVLFIFPAITEFYFIANNWNQTIISCKEYIQTKNTSRWVMLTNCVIDYLETVALYNKHENGKIDTGHYIVPIIPKNHQDKEKIKILLEVSFKKGDLLDGLFIAKRHKQEQNFIEKNYDKLVTVETISGVVSSVHISNEKEAIIKESYLLDENFIVIDEGQTPHFGMAFVMFVIGFLSAIAFFFPGLISQAFQAIAAKLQNIYSLSIIQKYFMQPIYFLFKVACFLFGNFLLLFFIIGISHFIPLFYNIHFNDTYRDFWQDMHHYIIVQKKESSYILQSEFEEKDPQKKEELNKAWKEKRNEMRAYLQRYGLRSEEIEMFGGSLPSNKMNDLVILDNFANDFNFVVVAIFFFPFVFWVLKVWLKFILWLLRLSPEAKEIKEDYFSSNREATFATMFFVYILVLIRCAWQDPLDANIPMNTLSLSVISFALTYTSALWLVFIRYIIDAIFIYFSIHPKETYMDDILTFLIGLPLLLFFDNSWPTIGCDLVAGLLPFILMKVQND